MEVTYDYYLNTFYGETVTENDFPKWIKRATDKMAYLTFNHSNTAGEEYITQLQDAACALADCMYLVDIERIRAAEGVSDSNIKSMASGGESVTFESQKTIYQTVLTDKAAENQLYRGIIAEYLHGTGILYSGA